MYLDLSQYANKELSWGVICIDIFLNETLLPFKLTGFTSEQFSPP